jgi:hypothetical protein
VRRCFKGASSQLARHIFALARCRRLMVRASLGRARTRMPRHSRGQAFAGASPFGWASFGAWRRSEQLLHRLGASWRRLGLVQMITGTDRSAPRSPTELFQLLDVLAGQSVKSRGRPRLGAPSCGMARCRSPTPGLHRRWCGALEDRYRGSFHSSCPGGFHRFLVRPHDSGPSYACCSLEVGDAKGRVQAAVGRTW